MASANGSMSLEPVAHKGLGLAALLALGAALYLTLMPFDFQPMALADAWAVYTDQTFSLPDPGTRQQWVANVLMFVPFGFFTVLFFLFRTNSFPAPAPTSVRILAICVASLLSLLVTASVELLQVWMPYRSTSVVDMSGNFTGGVLGAIVGATAGERLWRGGIALWSGERRLSRDQLLLGYCLLYVFVVLFPFDFPWSVGELFERFTNGRWAVWVAPQSCISGTQCLVLMTLKPLLAVPLGVWLATRWPVSAPGGRGRAALMAMIVALLLELMQLLLYSGVADGRSASLRAFGLFAGIVWADRFSANLLYRLRERFGPVLAATLVVPYAVVVVGLVTGFSGYHWNVSRAFEQLQTLNFMPFHYHFLVAEAEAARSLIYQSIAYAPVGGLVWLAAGGRRVSQGGNLGAVSRISGIAAGLALMLALVAESLKLFVTGLRPDPTSLLIAMVVAALVYRACSLLFDSRQSHSQPVPQEQVVSRHDENPARQMVEDSSSSAPASVQAAGSVQMEGRTPLHTGQPAWVLRGFGVGLWCVVLGAAVLWPVWSPLLVVGLIIYGVVLHFRPAACLIVLPAAAAVLDWSMLTGFEIVDEFDLLALASVASLLLCARTGVGLQRLPTGMGFLLALFSVSVVASSALAFPGAFGLADQGITAYMSEYNILRAIKGFAFALVLFLLIPQTGIQAQVAFRQYFVPGMTLGLFLIGAVVVWERAAYPGLLNFASPYRISGLFTEMRVGGPSIEAFLLLTLPFALIWLWTRPGLLRSLVVLGLLAGGLHALFVTYSRAGYLALAASVAVILLFGLIALVHGHRRTALTGVAGVLVVTGIVGGFAVLRAEGFATQRLGQIEADLQVRIAHWKHSLDLRRPGLRYAMLGHGPGMYPRESWLNSPLDELAANFVFNTDGDQGRLILGTGQSMYINQRVPWYSGDTLELEVTGRSESSASLWFFLCQKHVRHSFTCETERVRFLANAAEPQTTVVTLQTGSMGQPQSYLPRHLTIAVRNLSRGSVVSLEALQLRDQEGTELLRNADFSAGARHWYFTTDQLEAWRTENQWLELYFEQGWLGLFSFVLLTLVAFLYMLRQAIRGQFASALLLSALLGVLTIGIFSTVFFSPRVMLLFYLALLLGSASPQRHKQKTMLKS